MIEHFADYKAQLVRLSEEHTIAFKEEMQEAFEHGFKMWMPTTIQTSGRCCLTRTSISH